MAPSPNPAKPQGRTSGRGWKRIREKGTAWTKIGEITLYPLTRMLGRRRYRGLRMLRVNGPALIVANHISHLDPIFDVVFVRKGGRLPQVMAKASLWKIPVVGRILAGTNQIPVERGGGAGQKALHTAIDTLSNGGVVVIYPEGTVTKDPDFWPMKPRPGVASLALSGDFPVIPVVHWGTQHVYNSYADGKKFRPWPRKTIHVVAGEPIDLSRWRGQEVDTRAIRDVSYEIMGHLTAMLAEIRGETAPTALYDPKKAARAKSKRGGEEPAQ